MSSHTSLVIKDEKTLKEMQRLAGLDGKDLSQLTFELYEKYIKIHGSGNPAYTLDQFQDEGMKALPAFMEDVNKWFIHLQKSNDKDLDEIIEQSEKIFHYASAYRSINKFDRANTWFGTQKDAEAQAGF